MRLIGVDFTSRPTRAKPITVAEGRREGGVVRLDALRELPDMGAFDALLREPGPWLGGFDLPFGLPRELVDTLGWPATTGGLADHLRAHDRPALRAAFVAFCASRPAGSKFAHRAADLRAGSSPSMKWVQPPVAWMMHAGLPAIVGAGCHLPGLHDGDPGRVALEAYPGLLARELVGRVSYKSDDRARQTPARRAAREAMLDALQGGRTRLGLRLGLDGAQREALAADPRGDRLDAALCLVQAAWASDRPRHGWPEAVDPAEGWILTA
ncbi:MAG: hypothetical protein RL456_305 [Pseudomonadota bacterium]|jgi:hypothetical protein